MSGVQPAESLAFTVAEMVEMEGGDEVKEERNLFTVSRSPVSAAE
jgi:hypothetical protein